MSHNQCLQPFKGSLDVALTLTNSNGKRSRKTLAIRAPPVRVFRSDSFRLVPFKAVSKSWHSSWVNLKRFVSLPFPNWVRGELYPTSALVSELDELVIISVARYSATSLARSRCRSCNSRLRSGKHLRICSVNWILRVRCKKGTPIRSAISLESQTERCVPSRWSVEDYRYAGSFVKNCRSCSSAPGMSNSFDDRPYSSRRWPRRTTPMKPIRVTQISYLCLSLSRGQLTLFSCVPRSRTTTLFWRTSRAFCPLPIMSSLVRTPMVRLPIGSRLRAITRASEVTISMLAGVTARIRQFSLLIYSRIMSSIFFTISAGCPWDGTFTMPGKSTRVRLTTRSKRKHSLPLYVNIGMKCQVSRVIQSGNFFTKAKIWGIESSPSQGWTLIITVWWEDRQINRYIGYAHVIAYDRFSIIFNFCSHVGIIDVPLLRFMPKDGIF